MLLDLVIVKDKWMPDGEWLNDFSWEKLGFRISGTVEDVEQGVNIIEETKPDVVLLDMDIGRGAGPEIIEKVNKKDYDIFFVLLGRCHDFDYVKRVYDSCDCTYLLKPVDTDELKETMCRVFKRCAKRSGLQEKENRLSAVIRDTPYDYLQIMLQKYVQREISTEKIKNSFKLVGTEFLSNNFIVVCMDIDLIYKIEAPSEYESCRCALALHAEKQLKENFSCWNFKNENKNTIFIVCIQDNKTIHEIKKIFDSIKEECGLPTVIAISKPYHDLEGLIHAYEEASLAFETAAVKGSGSFWTLNSGEAANYREIMDSLTKLMNAVRKNESENLKKLFSDFIRMLPKEKDIQEFYLLRAVLSADDIMMESYGMTEKLRKKFINYYQNIDALGPARSADACYGLLLESIEARNNMVKNDETKYYEKYMSDALAYIDEHLEDENLSIVSVASSVYLNPVYFGRVFKNTMDTTFKKYLLSRRMEKAKQLLENGDDNIGDICERVGVKTPSYFSHLFKEYYGKLPSEYKKGRENMLFLQDEES